MSIVLDTKSVTTDAFAGLSLGDVTYSTVSLSWKNVSSSSAQFRIVDDASFESESVEVDGGSIGTQSVTGLEPGTSTKFYLQRYEVDTWIQQTSSTSGIDYVISSNHDSSLTVVTGSSSASLSWSNPTNVSSPTYIVKYLESGASTETNASVSGTQSVIPDLDAGKSYVTRLYVQEGSVISLLDEVSFTTSSSVAMTISDGPFASYIDLDWTDSVDSSGSNYRITNRTSGGDDVLVDSSVTTSATIRDLIPGDTYVFVLQRLELDGSWEDQSQITTTTLSTSVGIGSVGSRTLEVSWGSLYEGADFELLYNGTSSGRTSETGVIIRDLDANTAYTLELVVHELGEAVGLSTLGMTTNKSLTQRSLPVVIPAAIIIAVILLIIMKSR